MAKEAGGNSTGTWPPEQEPEHGQGSRQHSTHRKGRKVAWSEKERPKRALSSAAQTPAVTLAPDVGRFTRLHLQAKRLRRRKRATRTAEGGPVYVYSIWQRKRRRKRSTKGSREGCRKRSDKTRQDNDDDDDNVLADGPEGEMGTGRVDQQVTSSFASRWQIVITLLWSSLASSFTAEPIDMSIDSATTPPSLVSCRCILSLFRTLAGVGLLVLIRVALPACLHL